MIPYWILFAAFAAGAIQYRYQPRPTVQGGPLLLVMAVGTMLMIGLRYRVGGDWGTYLDLLNEISREDFWTGIWLQDPGYGVVNWLIGRAGMGVWAVNFVCALLFTIGLIKFARRQPNPWVAMVVSVPYLIIVVAMGYTRQAVAIGFVFWGLAEIDRASLMRFGLCILAAATFHKSAVVVVPLVALMATRGRLMTSLILLLSAPLLYYLFIQASIDRLMTNYVERGIDSSGAGIRVAMDVPPALLFLLYRKRFQLSDAQDKLWRNFSIATFVAAGMLASSQSTTAVDRLALYLIPLQVFVWSRLPLAFPSRAGFNKQIVLAIVAYSALVQFTWLNYATNAFSWVPYRFYPTATEQEM